MKQIIVLGLCLFASGTILAQYPVEHKKKASAPAKTTAAKHAAAPTDKKKTVAATNKKPQPAASKAVAVKQPKKEATRKVAAGDNKPATHRTAIGGFIHDARKHPLQGVQTFIYMPDSTIGASGYTDAMGYYETNSVGAGKYDFKVVYPNSKAVVVKGVPVKKGITQLSFNTNPPEADTTLLYADLFPKAEPKKKAK